MRFLSSKHSMKQRRNALIAITMIWLNGTLLGGCSSKRLLKKSGPIAPEWRMYDFSDKKGVIFHNKCKKKKGDDRKCKKTPLDILDNWDMFHHAPNWNR